MIKDDVLKKRAVELQNLNEWEFACRVARIELALEKFGNTKSENEVHQGFYIKTESGNMESRISQILNTDNPCHIKP